MYREPPDGDVCTEILPIQGLRPQCLLCSLHSGRKETTLPNTKVQVTHNQVIHKVLSSQSYISFTDVCYAGVPDQRYATYQANY